MKTDQVIEISGSITKEETLIPVNAKILEHSCVAEVQEPYENYYGKIPYSSKPNDLHLFTRKYYKLSEVLKITCDMKEFFGYTKALHVGTSILDFKDHYQYSIRISDFPDYNHIHWLQTCYNSKGYGFCKNVHLPINVLSTTSKLFTLYVMGEGIYLDKKDPHKGYIEITRQVSKNEFKDILINIRNNTKCDLFDAAAGSFNIESNTKNIIRVYTENLNMDLLKCIQQQFLKALIRETLLAHK